MKPQKNWLREVGEHTALHRATRARKLVQRRVALCVALRSQGFSESTIAARARWYNDRARGERERITRVEACDTDLLKIACQGFGVVHEFSAGCRHWRLCVRCRGAAAAALRARFKAARDRIIERARAQGLFLPYRRGGRYGERLLTLTLPHTSSSARERIRLAFAAWPEFLKLFNGYLRERCIRSVEWFRVFEWTEASDGLGHPHFHVWLFSPYLDVELIREWWRRALQSVGCAIEKHVIVDIAAVKDPTSAARELIKYMLKDICANGDKVPPAVFAQVYEALAGRRMRQGSNGFMGPAKRSLPCCDCGATLPRRVRIERRPRPTEGDGS